MKILFFTLTFMLISLFSYSQTTNNEKIKVTVVSSSKLKTDSSIYVNKPKESNKIHVISTKKNNSNKKIINNNKSTTGTLKQEKSSKNNN